MSGASGERVRVDKWLWAVRVWRTRTAANEACSNGRVRVNDEPAKAATRVGVGDTVTAQRRDRLVVYEVEKVIDKRVSASLAAECYRDLSPPDERPIGEPAASGGERERGAGRPTKRDRRQIDRLRNRR